MTHQWLGTISWSAYIILVLIGIIHKVLWLNLSVRKKYRKFEYLSRKKSLQTYPALWHSSTHNVSPQVRVLDQFLAKTMEEALLLIIIALCLVKLKRKKKENKRISLKNCIHSLNFIYGKWSPPTLGTRPPRDRI